jgi:hypothetical protein
LSMLKKLKKSSKELRILLLGLDNAGALDIRMLCASYSSSSTCARGLASWMAAMQATQRMRSESICGGAYSCCVLHCATHRLLLPAMADSVCLCSLWNRPTGKTSALKKLSEEEISHIMPTQGFNIKSLQQVRVHPTTGGYSTCFVPVCSLAPVCSCVLERTRAATAARCWLSKNSVGAAIRCTVVLFY